MTESGLGREDTNGQGAKNQAGTRENVAKNDE
jgi:hypothetical protein